MVIRGQNVPGWLLAVASLGVVGAVFGFAASASERKRRQLRGKFACALKDALQVGKGNVRLGIPQVRLCLTESQVEKLQPGEKIGCGSFACAYERPDGTVLKITQDGTDISTMMVGQGHPRVVKLERAYEIVGGDVNWEHGEPDRGQEPVYAAVVERLEQPDGAFKLMVGRLPLYQLGVAFDTRPERGGTSPRAASYEVPEKIANYFVESACKGYKDPAKQNRCANFAREVIDLHEWFGKKGIRLIDLHAGNFGIDSKTGDWKVLDVGFSKSGQPQVPELAAGERPSVRGKLLGDGGEGARGG